MQLQPVPALFSDIWAEVRSRLKKFLPEAAGPLLFRALPLILVVSALSALLFYWRIIPVIVKVFSLVLQKTMDIRGALGLGVAANIFVGMVEAPIIITPYVKDMTRSELMTLMISGMATISGTVLVIYASILNPVIPGAIGHILTASIISAPAAILNSRLMVPEKSILNETGKNLYRLLSIKLYGCYCKGNFCWSAALNKRNRFAPGPCCPCCSCQPDTYFSTRYFWRNQ